MVDQGQKAQQQMLNSNLRLVVAVVKRVVRDKSETAFAFMDVIQEGNIGLHRAVQLWDYKQGYKFSTYAHNWIWQAATRSLAESSRTIRLPVHMVDDLFGIKKIQDQLLKEGIEPTARQIALALDKTPEKVQSQLDSVARIVSLSSEWWVDRVPHQLADLIVDEDTLDGGEYVEERLHRQELRSALLLATASWPIRDRSILYDRWGLGSDELEPMT